MNIIEIYNKYYLPENLQMHMLRVAACSNLIIDSWNGPEIDREKIIRVCLLHDMGNIVKIPEDFSNDENFIETRRKYYEKYWTNDHEINLEIGKSEGLSNKEIEILDGKRSRKNEETLNSNSYERKICAYCDQRVAPNGVVGIKERLNLPKQNADILILAGGGHEKFARYSGIKYEENTLYKDSASPIMMDIETRKSETERYYKAISLDEIRSRVNDPSWWYATRAMSAFVLVVAEAIGAKYVVPTDIAMAYGILEKKEI